MSVKTKKPARKRGQTAITPASKQLGAEVVARYTTAFTTAYARVVSSARDMAKAQLEAGRALVTARDAMEGTGQFPSWRDGLQKNTGHSGSLASWQSTCKMLVRLATAPAELTSAIEAVELSYSDSRTLVGAGDKVVAILGRARKRVETGKSPTLSAAVQSLKPTRSPRVTVGTGSAGKAKGATEPTQKGTPVYPASLKILTEARKASENPDFRRTLGFAIDFVKANNDSKLISELVARLAKATTPKPVS